MLIVRHLGTPNSSFPLTSLGHRIGSLTRRNTPLILEAAATAVTVASTGAGDSWEYESRRTTHTSSLLDRLVDSHTLEFYFIFQSFFFKTLSTIFTTFSRLGHTKYFLCNISNRVYKSIFLGSSY